ncbi:Ubiquitin carboxyl-terminal hydrolase 16 [Haplosporangium sp. Z 767]|nr:Ubiquitin carboxyl-terminal hydrolase 16 [Haplosporangium sp. Z 767]
MAKQAEIATVEESVISSTIEASLQLSNQDSTGHLPQSDIDNDTDNEDLLKAIAEDQDVLGSENCQHTKDIVHLAKFRRILTQQKDWDHCQGCLSDHAMIKKLAQGLDTALSALSLADPNGDPTESLPLDALWICLSCCEISCGRMFKKHALVHYSKPENKHPLAMNLGTLDCCGDPLTDPVAFTKLQRCYACDDQLTTTASMALAKKSKGQILVPGATKVKVHTPGLQNLGNTCFFNSVIQVLAETRSLRAIFSEADHTDFPASLSARRDIGLGPLTTTFKNFLFTMWKQQGGIVTPRDLFTQIAKKWKVFRGFREQDSQELMRHLLDGIRQEELDLIKKEAEIASSTSAASVAKNEDSTPKYVPFIDSCFSGKLVSVIVCDACKKCSFSYEDFFDLSLPVKGILQAGGGSLKDQLIARSRAVGYDISRPSDSSSGENAISEADQGTEAHLRHVEKLLKNVPLQTSPDILSIERSLHQFTSVDCLDDENKFACENCYKLIKSYNETEENGMEHVLPVEETQAETVQGPPKDQDPQDTNKGDTSGEANPVHSSLDASSSITTLPQEPMPSSSQAAITSEDTFIMRRAYKRYMISSLPPTMILHLKRFEQSSLRPGLLKKVEDHVAIPVELDMAPYCIPESELYDEPEGVDQEIKVKALAIGASQHEESVSKKYRLYGATVHQGSLATGHYSNYVLSSKVELPAQVENGKEISSSSVSSSTVALNGMGLPDIPLSAMEAQQNQKKKKKKKKKKGTQGKVDIASVAELTPESSDVVITEEKDGKSTEQETRQWVHCSDTRVRLATLDEVLASRPYLLYYERCPNGYSDPRAIPKKAGAGHANWGVLGCELNQQEQTSAMNSDTPASPTNESKIAVIDAETFSRLQNSNQNETATTNGTESQ